MLLYITCEDDLIMSSYLMSHRVKNTSFTLMNDDVYYLNYI